MTGDDTAAGADDAADESAPTKALAQGTFDLLHPGHLHYLSEAASRADELHVIVARDRNVTHKPSPVCPDRQRRDMVAALEVVDEAHLGHEEDFFVPVREIDPDVVVLGFDQHHDVDDIRRSLRANDIGAEVVRASGREPRYDGELLSTNRIIDKLIEERVDADD
ncbi:adenylyltransferase/cytidyltransferase family protein [Halobaculum sp. D14]|uniref:adenylyltransferase/cytidyltransferase family protein n=1 Tax=unclassified Halobaculum TaxID=2640896 RepID=UPI003EBD9691